MEFLSSATTIATIDSDGVVELLSAGSATISMWAANNTSASSSILIACSGSATPSYEVRVSPSYDFVYDGSTQTFDVYAYYTGSMPASIEFDFAVDGSLVPSAQYTFTEIDGNSFSVKNDDMYLDDPLTIIASNGSLVKNIEIELLGAW